MSKNLPPEFKPYIIFLNAAKCIEPYNPIVSIVLRHCFIDYVSESLTENTPQPIVQYLKYYTHKLPLFPLNGAQETRDFADDLFNSLTLKFRSGKISLSLPMQFWICALLYSVLSGPDAEKRESLCIEVSLRLRRLIKNIQTGKFSSNHLPTSNSVCKIFRDNLDIKQRNQKYAIKLMSMGYSLVKPPSLQFNNAQKIKDLLDSAANYLHKGDQLNATKTLQNLLQLWK